MKQFGTIKEFGRTWNGYIFSFGNEKYFWGINSEYKEFVQEQFADYDLNVVGFWGLQNEDKNMKKMKKILQFFNGQENYRELNENDFISIGDDGFILYNLNKI